LKNSTGVQVEFVNTTIVEEKIVKPVVKVEKVEKRAL